MTVHCPGANRFRQPTPEEARCPFCKGEVEIWTDEVKAVCPHCKKPITRPEPPSCLQWCAYARECVGNEAYGRYMQTRAETIREQLLGRLEQHFGNDRKRIEHAKKVLHFAGELLKKEKGDWHIVIPASILHDMGIKEAERKYDSSAPQYQEKEGAILARKILLEMGLKKEDIEEIAQIVAHHHSPGKIDTQNFRVLQDADWLVNLKDEADRKDKLSLRRTIDRVFLTPAGKELAAKIYLV